MELEVIMSLIGSLGFPIVMCILMFMQMNKMTEQHKEEMAKVTEALNNNTLAVTQLADKLDK